MATVQVFRIDTGRWDPWACVAATPETVKKYVGQGHRQYLSQFRRFRRRAQKSRNGQ
jgi:hypothetical protein